MPPVNPAPPPITPASGGQNPYDFITNPGSPTKKGLLSGGSKQQRVIIVVIGALLILVVAIMIFAALSNSGKSRSADWLTLAQQQTEAIRVSTLGSTSAVDDSTKNLAVTARLTLESQQAQILKYAKQSGASTKPASLAGGKNSKTDSQLTTAKQVNNFDETFTKIMQAQLLSYAQNIKKLYDSSNDKSVKSVLGSYFNAVKPLLATQS